MKKCDIIIPVWNELEATRECIEKLRNNTDYPYRLVIIDNGSDNPTQEYLEGLNSIFSDFLLIRNNINLGFVKAINQGISSSNDPYICILNNDAFVTEKWLIALIETIEHSPENIGIANPTSNVFGKESSDGGRYEWQEMDSCRGFCMLIKREVVNKIGLFDEIYGLGYFEEKDFSRRAVEAGYISVRAKSSFVYHKDRLSFDKIKERDEIFKRNETIYNKRWGRPLSLAFVVRKENELKEDEDTIYNLLDKGHRANIFINKNNFAKGVLKNHIEIRYFPISDLFFNYAILFKIWKRRHKKKIDIIIGNDAEIVKFFKRFNSIHKADVLNSRTDNIASFCETKTKER